MKKTILPGLVDGPCIHLDIYFPKLYAEMLLRRRDDSGRP
jgi:hypothetical protein